MGSVTTRLDAPIRSDNADDIATALADPDRIARARDRIAAVRQRFTFDAHTGTLIALLGGTSGRR